MASFASTGWSPGASITVYARPTTPGAAVGASVTTATADTNGAATFNGLADATNYQATDGTVTRTFRTPPALAASGSANAPYGLAVGRGGATVPVGLRPQVGYDNQDATSTSITYRMFIPLLDPQINSILPLFGNGESVTGVGGDVEAGNPITVAAAIETSDSYVVPFTFNGQHTATIPMNGIATPDFPLAFGTQVTANDKFNVAISLPGVWVRTDTLTTGAGGADLTLPGSSTVAGGSGSYMYGPSLVLGRAKIRKPIVAAVTDSILDGYQDDFHSPFYGPVARACQALGFPLVKLSRGGETAQSWSASKTRRFRSIFLDGCTHAIVALGTNDGNATSSAGVTQIENKLLAVGNFLNGLGIKAYISTVPPRTTSTDAWATTANQTPVSGSQIAFLASLNQWIRSVPAPFLGVVDLEGLCSSAQDSGLWGAGKTSDGVHPSDAISRGALTTAVQNLMSGWTVT
jgi:lysophospholipase L1-like esterase